MAPGCMRLVLLAATFQTTAAALALPSVLTTHGQDLSRAILDGESSAEEKREALQMLEDVVGVMRRVMGPAHPDTLHAQEKLEGYRQELSVDGV